MTTKRRHGDAGWIAIHQPCPNKLRNRSLLITLVAITSLMPSPSLASDEINGNVHQQTYGAWIGFINNLDRVVTKSSAIESEKAVLKATEYEYEAARGDLGLTLNGSYSYYPDGSGSQPGGTFTDLEEYSEARISLNLMHLLARRSAKISSSSAKYDSAKFQLINKSKMASIEMMEDAVSAWSYRFRKQALQNALGKIQSAKRKLKLSESASLPEITKATPKNVAETLIMYSEIKNEMDAISPFFMSGIPDLPDDYSTLPINPPTASDIGSVASNDALVKGMEQQAIAYERQADSLRGNGVNLSIYSGYVVQTLRASPGAEEGPQLGVVLEIPLGSDQSNRRKAYEMRSRAAKLDAKSQIVNRQRALLSLRNEWAESVSNMNKAQEYMRQQANLYEKMHQRLGAQHAGISPEPWEVDMQGARYWSSVARLWKSRTEWMKNVLTWSVLDPEYLKRNSRPSSGLVGSLCAPLKKCTEI